MQVTVTNEMKGRMTKDGSVLKKIRSAGGGANGCIAGGVTLLIFAVLLGGLFFALFTPAAGALFGGLFGIPGLLLVGGGMAMQARKLKNYENYYERETGYDRAELKGIERELLAPDMLLFDNQKQKKGEGKPVFGLCLTKHYLVMPMMLGNCYVRRLGEMVGAAYSESIPGINGYKYGLVLLSVRDGKEGGVYNAYFTKETCLEIIQALKGRIPGLITDQAFQYEGKIYNMLVNWKDILALWQRS